MSDAAETSVPEAVSERILGAPGARATHVKTSGNSRVYRVHAGGASYALKAYPRDARDRLEKERAALRFMERHRVARIPRWIGDAEGFGLMTWIEGAPPTTILESDVDAAVAFVAAVKYLSLAPGAETLSPATEACLSAATLVRFMRGRAAVLGEVARDDAELATFLAARFAPLFDRHTARAERLYTGAGLEFDRNLQRGASLIPADFGFHNMLRDADGAASFVDFEYFGWDDPAKLSADLLLHPATTLDAAGKLALERKLIRVFGDDPDFHVRLHALKPLFMLRWGLIFLNAYLPEHRRARPDLADDAAWARVKADRLRKAEAACEDAARYDAGVPA